MNKNTIEYNKKRKEAFNNINNTVKDIISLFSTDQPTANSELTSILQAIDNFCTNIDNFFSDPNNILFSRNKNVINVFNLETEETIQVTVFNNTNNTEFYISFDNGIDDITFGDNYFNGKRVHTIVWEKDNQTLYEDFIPLDDISLEEIYLFLNENLTINLPESFFAHLNDCIEKTKSIYQENCGDYKYLDYNYLLLNNNKKISRGFSYVGELETFSRQIQYFKQDVLSKKLLTLLDKSTLSVSYDEDEKTFKINDGNIDIELVLADDYFSFTISSENDVYAYNIMLLPPEDGKLKFGFTYINSDDEAETFEAQCNSEIEDEEEIGDLDFIFTDLEKLEISIPRSFSSQFYDYIYSFYDWFNYKTSGFSIIKSPAISKINKVFEEINSIVINDLYSFFLSEDIEIESNRNSQIFSAKKCIIRLVRVRLTEDNDNIYISTGKIEFLKDNVIISISCEYDIDYDSQIFYIRKMVDSDEILDYVVELNNAKIYGTYSVFLRNIELTGVSIPKYFLENLTKFLLQLQNFLE